MIRFLQASNLKNALLPELFGLVTLRKQRLSSFGLFIDSGRQPSSLQKPNAAVRSADNDKTLIF
jgi:hypothetical protein|tara:strand:- start:3092 stop:3283 length:192 start_codon:yes stop_codon:yes gene_type:complete